MKIKIIIGFTSISILIGFLYLKSYSPIFEKCITQNYLQAVKSENISYKEQIEYIYFSSNSFDFNIFFLDKTLENIDLKKISKIIGHADDLGDSLYNITLSKQRAENIKNHLLSRDSSLTFLTEWYGSNNPIVPNINELYRLKNRSVEIIWMKK